MASTLLATSLLSASAAAATTLSVASSGEHNQQRARLKTSDPMATLISGDSQSLPTVMAPWNMDDRVDWEGSDRRMLNWTTLCFDMQYVAFGPHYNDSSLALDRNSARDAAKNKRERGVPALLRADHIFWS